MGWSDKYKKSINCNNPKGFSQKAHCAGKKKRENIMKISDLKNEIRTIVNERSINKIAKEQQKNAADIEKALDFYKKNKGTDKAKAFIKVLKKLGDKKKALAKEMDIAVSSKLKNVGYAGPLESVNEMDPYLKPTPKDDEEVDESVNEDKRTDYVKRHLNKIIPRLTKELKSAYRPLANVATSVENLIDVIEYDKRRDFKNTPKQQVELYKKADSIVKPLNAALRAMKDIANLDLRKSLKTESTDESVIEEGASTEEKRIAMLAVRKQAKYRNVDTATAIQDQIRALEDLKRDLKKGKIK